MVNLKRQLQNLKMDLLHTLKFGYNRSWALSAALLNLQELTLWGIISSQDDSGIMFYTFEIFAPKNTQNPYFLLQGLILNIITTLLLVLIISCKIRKLKFMLPIFSIFIKLFPFFPAAVAFNYCFSAIFQSTDTLCLMAAIANLPFLFGYLFLHEFINESLKFKEVDYCNQRVGSYAGALLLPAALLILHIAGPFYAFVTVLVKCGLSLLGLFNGCQYVLVQRVRTFYALFIFYYVFIKFLANFQILVDHDAMSAPYIQISIVLAGVVAAYILSNQVVALIWRRMLKSAGCSGQRSTGQAFDNDSPLMIRIENQITILVQAFLQRQKQLAKLPNHFSYFWREFNQIVFSHKLKCEEVRCICKNPKRKQQNEIEGQLFVNNLVRRVQNASQRLGKEMRLKVLNIYLLIEIAKKPLKGYFQLIMLKKQKTKAKLQLQIDDLVSISRQCFDQIFYKNKVQNQQLNLLKVIRSEQTIRQLQDQLKQTLKTSAAFLEIFTYSTLKMGQVQSESDKLNIMKRQIQKKLQILMIDCYQNPSVALASFVFYHFLQPYRSKEAEFKKAAGQQAMKKRLLLKAEGENISADQGIIYIDLVQERGRIKKITRNISDFFGYGREDMIGFNINLFMPTIFGKNHAKFLSNFIDKGRIKLLKEKQRVVFGKNKKKFIFPIQVSLKAEHLLDNQFGASALVNAMDTNSDFMIVGRHGRIEELTQGIYSRIFGRTFKEDVHKSSKICAYKLLPGLNQIMQSWDEKQTSKIFQGLVIYADQEDYLLQKFRYTRDSNYSSIGTKTKTSSLSLLSSSTGTYSDISRPQKYQFFGDLFKSFLADINPRRLRAFKLSYKYSKVKTAQFQVQLVQIISVKQQLRGIQFQRELLNQLNNVAQIFQLLQEQSPVAQHLFELQQMIQGESSLRQGGTLPKNEGPNLLSLELKVQNRDVANREEEQLIEDTYRMLNNSDDLFQDQIQEKPLMNNYQASQTSSVMGNTENQSKKQLLINAFNSSEDVIPTVAIICAVLAIVALLALLLAMTLIGLGSIDKVERLWTDSSYLLNLRMAFQFRLGLAELNRFSNNVNFAMPSALLLQQEALNLKIVNLSKSLISNTYTIRFHSSPFSFIAPIQDPNRNITYQATLPQSITKMSQLFTEPTQANNNTLRHNYQGLHQNLTDFYNQRFSFYQQQHNKLYTLMIALLAVYQVLIGFVALSSIPIYIYFKRQELAVRSKLAFMSQRQIKKAVGRTTLIIDFFKQVIHKSSVNRLQFEIGEKKFQDKEDNTGSKVIKITSQSEDYKVFSNPWMYCLLLLFVVFFSNLSIGLYVIFDQSQTYFLTALQSHKLANDLSIKSPMLLNVYMSNLNRALENSTLETYTAEIISQTQTQYFQLISTLSLPQYEKNTISALLIDGSTLPICQIINCVAAKQLSLQGISQGFKNRFDFWRPKNGITPDGSSINTWLTENSVASILNELVYVLALSLGAEASIDNTYKTQQKWLWTLTVLLCAVLMPINLIGLIIILRKYLMEVNQMVRSAEELYMNFPVQVLVENTYLTSYFTAKIKNGK